MTKCKICDVRGYGTANACAELGADFIGIHAIHGIKTTRESSLREIAERLPTDWPNVGIVLVTLETSLDSIGKMVRLLRPSHLQLHAGSWTGDAVLCLRDYLYRELGESPSIIAVAQVPSVSLVRVEDLCRSADFLLFDKTHYEKDNDSQIVAPEQYIPFVEQASAAGVCSFIAGGLDPGNVAKYVDKVRPWGVDVQRGVEKAEGVKDVNLVRAFLKQIRQLDAPQFGAGQAGVL